MLSWKQLEEINERPTRRFVSVNSQFHGRQYCLNSSVHDLIFSLYTRVAHSTFWWIGMAALTAALSAARVLSPILPVSAGHFRVVPSSARLPASDTSRLEVNLRNGPSSFESCKRRQISTINDGASRRLIPQPLRSSSTMSSMSKSQHGVVSRGADLVDDYNYCKRNGIEGVMTAVMTDVLQHCFKDECDVMREKVFDQLGSGFAALFRVWRSVAEDSSPAPIRRKRDLAEITEADLEQVRRLLQLTSLPFSNTYDEDLKQLTNMLQPGGRNKRLTENEFSKICDRLGSDVVKCLGPLVMCFPELPLYAKQRALSMPAEVAGKVALNLLAGPARW